MRKYITCILLLFCTLFLVSCTIDEQYTITYVYGDNINIETYEVNKGTTITLPTDTYEGYDILEFYIDDNYTTILEEGHIIKKDLTIFVKIELEKYNIAFYDGDSIFKQSEVFYLNKIEEPTGLTKEGYHLAGWTEDISTEKLYDFDSLVKYKYKEFL